MFGLRMGKLGAAMAQGSGNATDGITLLFENGDYWLAENSDFIILE